MNIIFLSRHNPRDIAVWSGTLFHTYQKLKEKNYFKIMDYGRKKSCFKSLLIMMFMMFIIHNSIPANSFQKEASEDTLNSSDGKWHPNMFYFVSPYLNVTFRLPYEPDQSGVYNLFLISKESGEILLLDTIKDNRRYITQFSYGSHYEVVLLYNNGKYVKDKDVIIENGASSDMRNLSIQPSDSLSKHLKTMRSFDDAITDRTSDSDDKSVSDFIIKGYVFSEIHGGCTWAATFVKLSDDYGKVKGKWNTGDGYFEFDVKENIMQNLELFGTGHIFEDIIITARCGLILVLDESRSARIWRMSPHLTKARKL